VTPRIQGMNRRLKREVEEGAEKRGHRWTLTSFMREAWNSTFKEIREAKEARGLDGTFVEQFPEKFVEQKEP